MRDIKQILKLHFASGLSGNAISKIVNVSRPSVHRCIKAAVATGLSLAEVDELSSNDLEGWHHK